jgi:hypothetical protein
VKPGATESLRKARMELEEVCRMLIRPSPEVLQDCEQRLRKAAEEMEAGRPLWSVADSQAASEARSTRQALRHVHRLLGNAAKFFVGWQRIRTAMAGQYRADGSLPELRCPARICVRG